MALKIIAQRGSEEDWTLLIQTDESHGFMASANGAENRSRSMLVDAFLKFGYWEAPTISLSQEELKRLQALPIVG